MIQDCTTFYKYGATPPDFTQGFIGIHPTVCCPFDSRVLNPDEYQELMDQLANPQFGIRNEFEEDPLVQPCEGVEKCVHSDECNLTGKLHPPNLCGWDPNGEDLFCCQNVTRKQENLPTIQKQYG